MNSFSKFSRYHICITFNGEHVLVQYGLGEFGTALVGTIKYSTFYWNILNSGSFTLSYNFTKFTETVYYMLRSRN